MGRSGTVRCNGELALITFLQEDTLSETVRHNFRIYREYGNGDNIEKFVVFAFESAELNPSVRMYDLLMRDYLKRRFGAEPEDLEEKWSRRCWNCGRSPQVLKTCTACKRAKYCDVGCQQGEWKRHKLLHKEMELTKQILEQNSREEDE